MKILSVDPGVERVGIAIVEKDAGKERVVFSECFKTSAKLAHSERLNEIGAEIARVIKEYAPKGLAIEKLFFAKNVTNGLAVAEARGVIIYEAARKGLSIYEYSPMEIKIAVTGYGKSDKKAVLSMTTKLVALPAKTMIDDEVDAIAVGLTCFAQERF